MLKRSVDLILITGLSCTLHSTAHCQDTIPFTLTEHNNIVVTALLNEKDTLELMFHTDAAEIGLTPEAAVRATSMTPTDSVQAISWGSDNNTATFKRNNHLRIGELAWDGLTVWTNSRSGHGTDGKFGPELFKGSVIEIDFDHGRMVIHDPLPKISDEFTKMNIRIDNGSLFLEGQLEINEESIDHTFLIHSGYSGTILLDDQFARKQGLASKLPVTSESKLSDSYGNTLKTKLSVLPGFILGAYSFIDMPIGFFDGHLGGEHRSVMGGELLKRFNMFLDIQHATIYLRPSGSYSTEFIQ